jgi:DNA-binding NtrC family response regulator
MARILLISDEPDLLEMCEGTLASAGHAVLHISPARTMDLAAATRWHPEVVLLDFVELTALSQIVRRLHKMHDTAEVPIVIMSGLPDAADHADEMGATFALVKPFTADALLDAVDGAIAETRHTATRPRYSAAKSRTPL